jgi:hypothetical protein
MKTSAVTLGALVVAVSAIIMALVLLLKGETVSIPTIPIVRSCDGSGDCTPLECADCMACHTWQGRCVYRLKTEEYCRCVEQETMHCVMDTGAPGKSVCTKVDKLHTKWSKCEPLELL